MFRARARRNLGCGALALAVASLANCGEAQDSPPQSLVTGGTTQDAVKWLRRYGGAGNESVAALARHSDGSWLFTGRFSCAVDFGGGAVVTKTPPAARCLGAEYNWFGDSYVLRLDP